jgi:hypothetical protein
VALTTHAITVFAIDFDASFPAHACYEATADEPFLFASIASAG